MTHPEAAARWVADRNLPQTPDTLTAKARTAVWWECEAGHDFQAPVYLVAPFPVAHSCPMCQKERHIQFDQLRRQLLADSPEIVTAWRDEEPIDGLTFADHGLRKLQCPQGHQPRIAPWRYLDMGCPHCRANGTRPQTPSVADATPELADQWHPTRNAHAPGAVRTGSQRQIWWRSQCCGHEWQDSPRNRVKYTRYRCPACKSILDSLGYRDPALALEWHPDNPMTPFHVRPFTDQVVRWRCTTELTHEWTATVSSRSAGTACPRCSTAGTSVPEQELSAALTSQGMDVAHGASVTRASGGRPWRVDMLITAGAHRVVVEYDGEYWHADKTDADAAKTLDLLASGHRVVRVRENDLPELSVTSPGLLQLQFRPRFEQSAQLAVRIQGWIATLVP